MAAVTVRLALAVWVCPLNPLDAPVVNAAEVVWAWLLCPLRLTGAVATVRLAVLFWFWLLCPLSATAAAVTVNLAVVFCVWVLAPLRLTGADKVNAPLLFWLWALCPLKLTVRELTVSIPLLLWLCPLCPLRAGWVLALVVPGAEDPEETLERYIQENGLDRKRP